MTPSENIDTIKVDSDQSGWWPPLLEFLVHATVGTTIFIIIGTPAVGLELVITWLISQKINEVVIYGLKFAEYLLFVADLLLFTIFIVRAVIRTAKKL